MAANEEASPICRGKNLSWETVMLFFNYMPKKPMPKDKFNSCVEQNINSWTQTHSQIARQLAFYYEEKGICYPRFNEASTLEDLFSYMIHWAHNYFVPNPFAPSLKGKKPTSIYSHLVKCIGNGVNDFDEALDSLFDIPLSSHDKVRVYLQNFSNIRFDQGVISLNENIVDTNIIIEPTEEAATNPKLYFSFFCKNDSNNSIKEKKNTNPKTLQQIIYGAPGTGKSHSIKGITGIDDKDDTKHQIFRTTFHPDYDYAQFVGCYKPTKDKNDPQKITYEFVPQVFTEAYVRAKSSDDQVYLIIEEINRGNCAQIFGDLFQLLDRDENGVSQYSIKPDKDLENYLISALPEEDVEEDGEKHLKDGLRLPANLNIIATMNTSDQSLFPMDSAFKRRWEWEYVPIKQPTKEDGTLFDWVIQLDGYECSWWDFIEALNQQIFDTTESEDKQLGYFFVKAKDGVIDADTFVNKVVFYLWNDVFKDENSDIFNYNEKVWADNDKKDLNDKIINLLNKKNLSFSTFAKDRELLSHYFIDSILQKAGKGLMTIISEDSVDLEDEEINTPNFDETKESRKEYWKLFADEYGRNNLTRQNVDERDKHFLDIKLGFAKLYIANTYLASQNKAAVSLYATDQEIGKAFLKYIENNYQKEGISKTLGGYWKDKNKNALFEYECISKDKKAMAKEMAKKAHQFCDIFKRVVAEFKNNYKNK